MRKSRFSEEQIVGILKEAEHGAKITELLRRHGISKETLYRWRRKYGGLKVSDAKVPTPTKDISDISPHRPRHQGRRDVQALGDVPGLRHSPRVTQRPCREIV